MSYDSQTLHPIAVTHRYLLLFFDLAVSRISEWRTSVAALKAKGAVYRQYSQNDLCNGNNIFD